MTLCPCRRAPAIDSGDTPAPYEDCCQPYHEDIDNADGIKADSAERLMRTRYSAFVKVLPDYIIKTTVPAQQHLLEVTDIESWAQTTDWAGLEVIAHTPKLGKRHAQVEFKAYFRATDKASTPLQAHHELSTFIKIKHHVRQDARWYFLDPTVSITVTQKQPCICSSGEKFKRCCGQFLA